MFLGGSHETFDQITNMNFTSNLLYNVPSGGVINAIKKLRINTDM